MKKVGEKGNIACARASELLEDLQKQWVGKAETAARRRRFGQVSTVRVDLFNTGEIINKIFPMTKMTKNILKNDKIDFYL